MAGISLLLDEDVRVILADILRQRSYDAVHVLEIGRGGRSDREQLAHAASLDRTILTHNIRDFLFLDREYREERKEHAGIIVSDQVPLKELLRRTLRCLGRCTAESVQEPNCMAPGL
ncbi:DUF5615 family PIN-like protein [Acidobacteria bacterium AH-259-L09]|nr:DUF5615 family PIN-like protein [Acidobacteria bacterium AH-259-L09]